MRYSQLLIPTVKEVPAEAEIPSHQLMIRAGFIRKLASGTYIYMPLGQRMLLKAIAIVRDEMNRAGAQEITMPILQPLELWQQTGRDVVFKDIMCQFTDRHARGNVLSPTAEEVVTAIASWEISSYKQLPVNLYQIHDKFRDEFRPQYGVIRSREFLMKDAYSFDATPAGLDESYRRMYDAYSRIFRRCGLKFVVVQAESGGMGGTDTEEFMVPAPVGDTLVMSEDGAYAANVEKAQVDPARPDEAALAARAAVPAAQEVHTPNVGSIEAVCKFLGTQPADMIKTLIYTAVFEADGKERTETLAALVRGDHEVNENKLIHATGAARVELANEAAIRSLTGAAVGFAGPIGLAAKARVLVDHSVAAMVAGVSGANKTDYHVRNVVPGRDFALSGEKVVVADIRNAAPGDTWQGKPLKFSFGIEVGHVFKLGTKYSQQLGATFLDEKGQRHPCIMGCYGIGVNRILAMAIEQAGGHDDNGCVLPVSIAPFEAEIVPINIQSAEVMAEATRLYDELSAAGVDVLLDDRDARPGVKFKDADLLGIPLRIVVGEKGLKEGSVEIKRRTDAKPSLVKTADAVANARGILSELWAALA
jgi:prolyl-tRNA synthetase